MDNAVTWTSYGYFSAFWVPYLVKAINASQTQAAMSFLIRCVFYLISSLAASSVRILLKTLFPINFLPEAKPTGLVETMSVRCQFDARGVWKSADRPHLTTWTQGDLGK